MKLLTILILIFSTFCLSAINLTYDKVRNNLKGIRYYEEQDYESAIQEFEDNVINHPGEGSLHFNLGNSYYRRGDFDQAVNEYSRALRDDNFADPSLAYHNIGNALFEQQNYQEALESYRNALINNPDNNDARYNYELTRMFLEQSQTEQQPQSGEGESEEEEQEQQDQSQAEPSESDEGEEGQVAEQQESEAEGEQDQQQAEFDQKKLDEAEEVLRTLMSRERQLLEEEREQEREAQDRRGRWW
jgi:Ca-activated chloride channel homolog